MTQQTGRNYFRVMTELLSCDDFCSLQECFFDQKSHSQDIGKNNGKTRAKQQTKPLVRHKKAFSTERYFTSDISNRYRETA